MMKLVASLVAVAVSTLTVVANAAPPSMLEDYVVLGVNSPVGVCPPGKPAKVALDDELFVAEGNVGVDDCPSPVPTWLQLGSAAFMPDQSAVVSSKCTTTFSASPPPSDTSVFNLFANGGNCVTGNPVDHPHLVRGTTSAFMPPLVALPALPSFPPPSSVSPTTQPQPLQPGAYAALVVEQNVTFVLAGGPAPYFFPSVKVQGLGKLLVNAPATINVTGALNVGAFGNFGPNKDAPSAVNPNDIHVNCGCGSDRTCTTITFDRASHVGIALYAPNATLRLNRSFRGKGRFVANYVSGDQALLLRAARAPVTGPASQFTTLTQEEYGAVGGRANDLASGLVTLHPEILPVTLGGRGIRSLTIPRPPAGEEAKALECFLPAVHANPAALCALEAVHNVNDCVTTPTTPDFPQDMQITDTCSNVLDRKTSVAFCGNADSECSRGQGGGTLTGQTLAAKLNVALSAAQVTPASLGDFVLPYCLCTNTNDARYANCQTGRQINNTAQQNQGRAAGVEDGLTTVNDLLALADQALASDCNCNGVCARTCATAFAPPDPIRIGEIEWALQSINECFSENACTDPLNPACTAVPCTSPPCAPSVIPCPVGACTGTPPQVDVCPN